MPRAAAGEHKAFIAKALAYTGDDCLLWPYGQAGGYGGIKYPGISGVASRVVCTLAHGEPPAADLDAAHSCGNKACVAPRHLRWATRSENLADNFLPERYTPKPRNTLLTLRLTAEMKQHLEQTALGDSRSVSSLVTKILRDWLIARQQA